MSGEKKQRYRLHPDYERIRGLSSIFLDGDRGMLQGEVEDRLNELTDENERLEAEVDVAYESGNQACIAQHEVQERLDARIAALTRRVEELEAALRLACTVKDRIAYRTKNSVPMEMPPKVEKVVRKALAEGGEK